MPGRRELVFVWGKQEAMAMHEDFGGRAKVYDGLDSGGQDLLI